MPEGPEIKRLADALAKQLAGRVIDRIHFSLDSLQHWDHRLTGAKIKCIKTYGKAMVICLNTVMDNELNIYSHNQLYGRWIFCHAQPGTGPLSQPELALVYRLRRPESIPECLHQLVSDDHVFEETRG